ncbi:phage tail protein [Zavarzinella formosa]|uniref:phage tail protein n=1 Tax=Zavarzinella formosa TaxID=360055 RepID=UPI000312910D|nr:phage tail protein [Zavarzinella formosa]
MARAKDPYVNYNFLVEIQGIVTSGFKEVSGLDSKIEVVDYREGGDAFSPVRKLPGKVTFSNVVLKTGFADDTTLRDWHLQWVKGEAAADRRDVTISLRDRAGNHLKTWTLKEAWPASYQAPSFNAEAHEVAIYTVELAHEGIEYS